jgi:hypothetical protein
MQLAPDYATAEGASAESDCTATAAENGGSGRKKACVPLNERYLNQGRSLARPQNKVVDKRHSVVATVVLRNTWTLKRTLTEKRLSLAAVRGAVALTPESEDGVAAIQRIPTARRKYTRGMKNLCQHMQSLGPLVVRRSWCPCTGVANCRKPFVGRLPFTVPLIYCDVHRSASSLLAALVMLILISKGKVVVQCKALSWVATTRMNYRASLCRNGNKSIALMSLLLSNP